MSLISSGVSVLAGILNTSKRAKNRIGVMFNSMAKIIKTKHYFDEYKLNSIQSLLP